MIIEYNMYIHAMDFQVDSLVFLMQFCELLYISESYVFIWWFLFFYFFSFFGIVPGHIKN